MSSSSRRAGLDLGEVEQVVDDAQQRLRRIAHRRDAAALLVVEALVLQHLHHAEHAVHRRADFVAHGGEEGRFGLGRGFGGGALLFGGVTRRFGGRLGLRQGCLALLELGDVARHRDGVAVVRSA